MTVNTNTGFEQQVATRQYAPVAFIKLDFQSGSYFGNTWGLDIDALGYSFKGVSNCEVGELKESEDGNAQRLSITLNGVRPENIALALASADKWQDRNMFMWIGMINPENGQLAGNPVLRFAGTMQDIKVTAEKEKYAVELECRSGTYSDVNKVSSLRMTDAQQQQRYPGDRGLEFMVGLVASPPPWVTLKYQQVRTLLGV